jgi:hypothetical protein
MVGTVSGRLYDDDISGRFSKRAFATAVHQISHTFSLSSLLGLPSSIRWAVSPHNYPSERLINDFPCTATTFFPPVQSAVAQSRRKTHIHELPQLHSQDGLNPWLAGQHPPGYYSYAPSPKEQQWHDRVERLTATPWSPCASQESDPQCPPVFRYSS